MEISKQAREWMQQAMVKGEAKVELLSRLPLPDALRPEIELIAEGISQAMKDAQHNFMRDNNLVTDDSHTHEFMATEVENYETGERSVNYKQPITRPWASEQA